MFERNSAARRWIPVLGVVATSSVSAAQSAGPVPVTTHLRVTDGAGLPVRDLAAGEIDIRIGGRTRPVQLVRPAAPVPTSCCCSTSRGTWVPRH
jgi:hypothetical protein